MTGLFSDHAPDYIAHDIPVFPTGGEDGKRPLVKNHQKLGRPYSSKLASNPKFVNSNIGFMCGWRTRITVLDVDSPDRKDFDRALKEFGDSPIKIQTASGKYHAWYRYNGEHRKIRPFDGEEIDILGGGVCIAPPSVRPDLGGKTYRFLEGGLNKVDRLRFIKPGALAPEMYGKAPAGPCNRIKKGERTDALYDELRRIAYQCDTLAELAFRGAGINEAMMEPLLTEAKVMKQAQGVWKLKQEDHLIVPGSGAVVIGRDLGRQLYKYPPALALWHFLKSIHGPDHEIAVCPKGLAKVLPYSIPTIRKARNFLVGVPLLDMTYKGGGDKNPNRYRFTKRGAG